jgi:hypothetical protein
MSIEKTPVLWTTGKASVDYKLAGGVRFCTWSARSDGTNGTPLQDEFDLNSHANKLYNILDSLAQFE